MQKVLEQEMREGIGSELADILYRQQVIVKANDSLNLLKDEKVKEEFKTMAQEDQRNLRLLETVVSNFGIRMEPKESSARMAKAALMTIGDEAAFPLEKLGAYLLLKQQQMMCSHLIQKSAQLAQPDVKTALSLFDGVNVAITRQVNELTGLMEKSGVEWITGKEPISGFIGRARDAISSMTGAVLGKTAQPADETSILNILKKDHRKIEVLFKEIKEAKEERQAVDLFHQLKADLTSHSIAEEETFYSRYMKIASMKSLISNATEDHEELRLLLDDISEVQTKYDQFLKGIGELEDMVRNHVDEEENQIFEAVARESSYAELVKLSGFFLQAKRKIQENIGTEEISSSAVHEQEGSSSMAP